MDNMIIRYFKVNLSLCLTKHYDSVFVFSLRAAFDCLFNLKTLKVHNMFRSLRPSSGVKLWIEEVAVLAFLGFISHICLFYCSVLCICRVLLNCVRQDAKI
jgi:hypothetical protein